MTQDAAPDAPAAVLPSTCTLYLGDCLDILPTLNSVNLNMIFADFPYNLLTWTRWDKPVCLDKFWLNISHMVPGNAPCIFTANMNFAARIIASNPKHFRYDLVWEKASASNPFLAKKRPLCYHENVLVFYRGKPTYNPVMRPASERKDPRNKNRIGSTTHDKFFNIVKQRLSRMCGPLYPSSIIKGQTENKFAKERHPTQKPVALLEWLIKTYTNPGDTVLDPVFGSCTTGVACARLGRSFIGIEKDPEYFRIGRERVDNERAKLGLQPCEANQ